MANLKPATRKATDRSGPGITRPILNPPKAEVPARPAPPRPARLQPGSERPAGPIPPHPATPCFSQARSGPSRLAPARPARFIEFPVLLYRFSPFILTLPLAQPNSCPPESSHFAFNSLSTFCHTHQTRPTLAAFAGSLFDSATGTGASSIERAAHTVQDSSEVRVPGLIHCRIEYSSSSTPKQSIQTRLQLALLNSYHLNPYPFLAPFLLNCSVRTRIPLNKMPCNNRWTTT
jgi:hypothetical protein